MKIYEKILDNQEYLNLVKKIESIRFISDGKWDWEHGLGHYKRVGKYVENVLTQLNADERTIELGITAALLHDIGLSKGDKVDHAIVSSELIKDFISPSDVTSAEMDTLKQAIRDHSKGDNISSLIGCALLLADKLDVTYHRTEASSIHDTINNEILKIKKVEVSIDNNNLIVNYTTEDDFLLSNLLAWPKVIRIPYKAAKYLNKTFSFKINNKSENVTYFLSFDEAASIFYQAFPISKGKAKNPWIILFDGYSGMGKSTISLLIAKHLDAIILNNDEVRQFINDSNDLTNLKNELQIDRLVKLLKNHNNCILDSCLCHRYKEKLAYCKKLGYKYYVIRLECPDEIVEERLSKRCLDGINFSLADFNHYLWMKDNVPRVPEELVDFTIDTSEDLNPQVKKLCEFINKSK